MKDDTDSMAELTATVSEQREEGDDGCLLLCW